MWAPLHRRPTFASPKKKQKVEEQPPSAFLSEAKTEKLNCENVDVNGLEVGHASLQGYRVSMEDEHIIDKMDSLEDHTLVAIMDGECSSCKVYRRFLVHTEAFLLHFKAQYFDSWKCLSFYFCILRPRGEVCCEIHID